MDPRITSFLDLVLPTAGFKVVATPVPDRGFRHYLFKTNSGLVENALARAEAEDVYFALAGYRERYIEQPSKKDGKTRKRVRVAANVAAVRALWLDIDCDKSDPAKGYPSKAEGAAAILAATRTLCFPAPVIVDSGGGFHCYWPLSEDVGVERWVRLAERFKAAVAATGLRADPSRTADVASVLRLPGTANHKRGDRRPVRFVRGPETATVFHVEQAEAAVDAAIAALGIVPPAPKQATAPANALNADLTDGLLSGAPSDPKLVIRACAQMRRIATQQADIEEPLWYAGLAVARHCTGGRRVAHAVSSRHPGYSPGETDAKVDHLEEKDIGPTTCARFASLYPAGCAGCAYQGKITSPIQLGKTVVQAPPPVVPVVVEVEAAGVTFTLPEPPEPYARTRDGRIVIQLRDEMGVPQPPELVYQYDLYPVRRIIDEFTGRVRTVFRTMLPIRGEFEFEVDNQDLYDSRALPKALANADLLPSPGKLKILGDYMVSYTQRLQERAEAVRLYMQMGWRDNDSKFISGKKLFLAGQSPREIGVSSATALAAEKLTSSGSLDEWRRIVAAYSQPGMESYLFGFTTAFGAPLFGFTNYSGCIINMMSRPGTGKSTVLKAMNSVYGHPESLMFSKEDTTRSVYRRIGVYNSLPIAFDEITNIEGNALSDLAYTFSQGRERMRLTAAATERKDAYRWATIMAATSNSSLHDKLGALKADASAETVRIFEYRMPDTPPLDAVEAKTLFDGLYENYGLAGDIYLQYVVDHVDEIRAQLKKMIDLVFRRANSPSTERFWIATIAANLTGAMIAKKCGLIDFDAQRLLDWAVNQIDGMRATVSETTYTPVDAIGMFLNAHIRDTLVVDTSNLNADLALGAAAILRKPSGELVCRLEMNAGVMYVDRTRVRQWCAKNNIGYTWLRKELTQRFVLLSTDRRRCLGAGTDYATAQTYCWVLDMTTSHMGEIKSTIERGGVVPIAQGKVAR